MTTEPSAAGSPGVAGAGFRWALFLPSLAGGGAERVTLNLARGLVGLGHRVDLVLAGLSGAYVDQIPEGVRTVDLRAGRTLRAMPALIRYLRKEKPDGMLSAMNHTNVVAIWAARLAGYRGPLLVAEHNELAPGRTSRWQRLFNASIRFSYPRAKKVVAVSHGVKRSLVEHAGISDEHIMVIYNPVITPALQLQERSRPPALPAGGPPVVLGVGRLTRQKNFSNLLRAFAVLRQHRTARLLILGEGEEREDLTELAVQLGIQDDVSMPGFVHNPYDFIAYADLFALSSDWEGLPTVLIEALALGTRVVSTDCPSGPREILDQGRFGTLVPVGDSAALGNAMHEALSLPPRPVAPAWLGQFSEAEAARRYLHAFGLESTGP